MIIFKGTKTVSGSTFMVFTNEHGSECSIPVEDKIASYFTHHFDRFSPGVSVESDKAEDSEGS